LLYFVFFLSHFFLIKKRLDRKGEKYSHASLTFTGLIESTWNLWCRNGNFWLSIYCCCCCCWRWWIICCCWTITSWCCSSCTYRWSRTTWIKKTFLWYWEKKWIRKCQVRKKLIVMSKNWQEVSFNRESLCFCKEEYTVTVSTRTNKYNNLRSMDPNDF
jgi:hypothetical protein